MAMACIYLSHSNLDSKFLREKNLVLITKKTVLKCYKFTRKHQQIFQYCQNFGLM